jgi:hypothetical protein
VAKVEDQILRLLLWGRQRRRLQEFVEDVTRHVGWITAPLHPADGVACHGPPQAKVREAHLRHRKSR